MIRLISSAPSGLCISFCTICAISAVSPRAADCTAPVSYTHLSGIQPSGDLTLGSYLGAIKNWAALADEYDCYYMLADMHTITVRQVPADLRRRTLTQVAAYIACGLDPEKNTLFVQSHVPVSYTHLDVYKRQIQH